MSITDDPIYRTLSRLREDALSLGFYETARTCSHSLMRLTAEEIARQIGAMRLAAKD